MGLYMAEHAPHCTDLQKKILHHECPEHGLEYFLYDETVLAVLLRTAYKNNDIKFFTPSTFSQQLGYMNRPTGYDIPPHDHNPVSRNVEWTQETLFIRSGRVRLDLYAPGTRNHLGSCELLPGDVVLLAHGGHGFHMLEPSEMIEVKQGPYAGDMDKTRFVPQDGPLARSNAHE